MEVHRLLLSLFLYGILSINESVAQAVKRSGWSEYCNETIKCDKGAWLTCRSSACACMLEDMIYDKLKLKCVSKSGERCKFQISDLTSETIGIALYENTDCVSNSNCGNGFTCTCEKGFYETMEGECLKQKAVSEACESSAECSEAKLLFCIEGRCQCSNESEHIYARPNNNTEVTCVGKAGKLLSGATSCVEGATLRKSICACDPGESFYAGEDGRCYERKNITEECSKDEECKFEGVYLKCVGGRCDCDPQKYMFQTFSKDRIIEVEEEIQVRGLRNERPDHSNSNSFYRRNTYEVVSGTWVRGEVYGYGYITSKINKTVTEVLSQCVGLASLSCNPESNCVKDSLCKLSENGSDVCTCERRFSPTSIGTCGIGHGESCSLSTPCSDSFLCTKGICNCPQTKHQQYISGLKKCSGLVSSVCDNESDCLSNSDCAINPNTGKKQCSCSAGFVENRIGKCEKSWSSGCDYRDNIPCDTVAELECRNGVCSCPDTLTSYDITQRRCLGLVGSRCRIGDDLKCVAGAECIQVESKVAGQCLCQEGFSVNAEMFCVEVVKSEATETPGIEPTTMTPIPTEGTTEQQNENRDRLNELLVKF